MHSHAYRSLCISAVLWAGLSGSPDARRSSVSLFFFFLTGRVSQSVCLTSHPFLFIIANQSVLLSVCKERKRTESGSIASPDSPLASVNQEMDHQPTCRVVCSVHATYLHIFYLSPRTKTTHSHVLSNMTRKGSPVHATHHGFMDGHGHGQRIG